MKRDRFFWVLPIILAVAIAFFPSQVLSQSPGTTINREVVGTVLDPLGQPVEAAHVTLRNVTKDEVLAEADTQPDGSYLLDLPNPQNSLEPANQLQVHVERAHFEATTLLLNTSELMALVSDQALIVPQINLTWSIDASFWVATGVFILMLVLIATGLLQNTLAALFGASLIFAFSYLGSSVRKDLFIFGFQRAMEYVDWNVIFLVMGMMIVIAVVERTGIFQWLAFMAYRLSGGRIWLLVPILMIFTGIASAFLDNVTTMLLMTPITVQIALSLAVSPLALLVPEVLASNVVGISTLIGTPTNILIGSFARISFADFLTNLTPGVLLALLGLIIYSEWVYRQELKPGEEKEVPEALVEKLEEQAQITEPEQLKKAGVIGASMLLLFIFGEHVHLLPSVTALMGATALLVWIRPDIEEMIEAVDWTTLVFFIALFIVVGGVQEVGLISVIAENIGKLVGKNLILAILVVIWFSALFSMVVANIPFTAAMLPVIAYLSATIPGATNKVLFYGLSIGSAMGGNGTLIGASANMVTAGISDRAGYPLTYAYFFKKGFPALLVTVTIGTLWILFHF